MTDEFSIEIHFSPLRTRGWEEASRLASRASGEAAVAACSVAPPVIAVSMSKISCNPPTPCIRPLPVGGIFSIINLTTGVFSPRRSVMNDANDDCCVAALWCVLPHALFTPSLICAASRLNERGSIYSLCNSFSPVTAQTSRVSLFPLEWTDTLFIKRQTKQRNYVFAYISLFLRPLNAQYAYAAL